MIPYTRLHPQVGLLLADSIVQYPNRDMTAGRVLGTGEVGKSLPLRIDLRKCRLAGGGMKLWTLLPALTLTAPLALAEGLITVNKDPNCGCCIGWMAHMASKGYNLEAHNVDNLNEIKADYGVDSTVSSCHTAVTDKGYVLEGHVPARYVEQFLAAPPDGAIGLSVAGMPVGSPGMEMGDTFQPYEVVLIMEDGAHRLFAEVNFPEEQ